MKGLQLSDPFCVKAAAGDVSQRTCHSLIRKAGVEKEEEKESQSGNCPPSIKRCRTLKRTVYTHTLTMTLPQLLVRSDLYTPAISTSHYWPGTVYLIMETNFLKETGAHTSTELQTSKVFKENRSFSGRDPFLPRGQLSELRSYDDSLRQKPGNRSQRKQANRRK